MDRCYKKARDRRTAADKARLAMLSGPTNEQDEVPLPEPEVDPVYDDLDNDFTGQLNI